MTCKFIGHGGQDVDLERSRSTSIVFLTHLFGFLHTIPSVIASVHVHLYSTACTPYFEEEKESMLVVLVQFDAFSLYF